MRVGHDSAHVERHALNRQVEATKCEYTPVKRDSINTNTVNEPREDHEEQGGQEEERDEEDPPKTNRPRATRPRKRPRLRQRTGLCVPSTTSWNATTRSSNENAPNG